MKPKLEVISSEKISKDRLAVLSQNFELEHCSSDFDPKTSNRLVLDAGTMPYVLSNKVDGQFISMSIDFNSNKTLHRLKTINQREPLVKAIRNIEKTQTIFDLTAGLGGDSLVMVNRGFKVVAIEKNSMLWSLLSLAHENWENFGLKERLSFYHGDSLELLRKPELFSRLQIEESLDVVYLDPMFPESKKTALPNKEMQILRSILGHQGDDVEELLELSVKLAKNRVLVKRPIKSPPIKARPDSVFEGKSFRIDMYLTRA